MALHEALGSVFAGVCSAGRRGLVYLARAQVDWSGSGLIVCLGGGIGRPGGVRWFGVRGGVSRLGCVHRSIWIGIFDDHWPGNPAKQPCASRALRDIARGWRGPIMIKAYAAVNRWDVAKENLLVSPDIVSGKISLACLEGCASASACYAGKVSGGGRQGYSIFLHQDVYLPDGWLGRLESEILKLPSDWAVAGCFGATEKGLHRGHLWCGTTRRLLGGAGAPARCCSLDEVLLVLRHKTGVDFDPTMPTFHLYGTDVCMEALRLGLGAYVIDAPIVHNSLPIPVYDKQFLRAYRFVSKKWHPSRPIATCTVPVGRSAAPVHLHNLKALLRGSWRKDANRHADPVGLARQFGFHAYQPS